MYHASMSYHQQGLSNESKLSKLCLQLETGELPMPAGQQKITREATSNLRVCNDWQGSCATQLR